MLPPFELIRPGSVADALGELSEDAVPYCGGTELFLAMKMGLLRPETLIDLKSVPELAEIRLTDGGLQIGSAATHFDVSGSDAVMRHLPVLAYTEHRVGNVRVRAQGSIGGNLCFAEPRSDVTTVLAALDASVTLRSTKGERTIKVTEFLLGAYWVEKEPDELLMHITVPTGSFGAGAVYLKMQTSERPTVGVALVDLGERFRVAIGAAAEVPLVRQFDSAAALSVSDLVDELEPIEDLAGSVRYKRHVTGVYLQRALDQLKEQAA